MDNEALIYIGVTLISGALVLIGAPESGFLELGVVIIAILGMVLILVIYFADFLVFPIFTKIARITIIPGKDYSIPPSEDAIIKFSGGIYYATGYLTANIYNYVFAQEEISEEEKANITAAPDKWERAVMNLNFPFKFNIVSTSQEIQKYRDELEGKRGLLQFQYSKEVSNSNANPMTLRDIERRMNVVQARIDRLGGGERPIDTMLYFESTAVGVSEKDAMDALTTQLDKIQTIFNGFDLSIVRVVGREMYLLHKLNYSLPDVEQLKATFQTQR
ncbi:MAG: hypothetical protein KGH72_01780 [Candidatus Micrarchaeota archaeon]|nr:hypothetical protein [Candidatus Micrarchaeota archaeon]